MTMKVADVRREYGRAGLSEEDLAADPIDQFQRWLDQAKAADPQDFTAMTLATADGAGRPSARVVLLKGVDERGFVFYTDHGSRKGRELLANPRAALVFYWASLDRQVRVEGTVETTSRAESEAYFASRPRGSRLGAWASEQSRPISGRAELERLWSEAGERFPGDDVPLPDDWGGFRVRPEAIEFWQGRPSRLHDRLVYTLLPAGGWKIERLAP
ncbi:MAG TPA: pyridoxamine 5'-phosphate oxidase [Thermoanaerobaculia bacterium]|jgi:pyridoxamine 5'-phosphate oxidase|nr:pyridoxamine 5'-phosphate oxidase [Thermoanaerobaculia bacterium]